MKRDRHNKSLLKCEYNKYLIIVFYVFCIFPALKIYIYLVAHSII